MGFTQSSNKNMNVKATSFDNSAPPPPPPPPLTKCNIVLNEAWIGKLEKEVLPPQWCVASGRSSSSWVGRGAAGEAGGMATTVAAASRLREAAGVGWAEGTDSAGG